MNEATQRFFEEVYDSALDWHNECCVRAADELNRRCDHRECERECEHDCPLDLDELAELYFVERLTRAVYQLGYGFVERIAGGPVDVVDVMFALYFCFDALADEIEEADMDEELDTAFEAGYDCGWSDGQDALLA